METRLAHLLQDASALAGYGQVSQEGEGQHLDGAVVRGDPRGQLQHRVHQRAPVAPFGYCCSTGAAATQGTAGCRVRGGVWRGGGGP